MNLNDVILKAIITEKSSNLRELSEYVLKVDPRSNKILIKNAVEKLFDVKVDSVRVVNRKAKVKKSMFRRGRPGVQSSYKKAYVRLVDGAKIAELEV